MAFIKNVEDFTCEHCGAHVKGTGYTNHCPVCLWSKHVDVDPGDRAASCGGLMEPVSIEGTVAAYVITHRCTKCGHTKRNKAVPADRADALVQLAAKTADSR